MRDAPADRRAPSLRRRAGLALSLALTCAASAPAATHAHPTPTYVGSTAPSGAVAGALAADRLGDPGVVSDVPAEAPPPPELAAASYVLADLGSGSVLVGKAAHTPHLPASTMKLLTAQTVLPRLDPQAKVNGVNDDAAVDGTKVGLVPEHDYTVRQLSEALLLTSANDAAEALARANGGLETTLNQMRARAAELGAKDTVPKTPHGLDAPGQQTTAYDLVAILRGALDTPRVAELLSVQTSTFPGAGKTADFQIASTNKLLWNYPGAIGGKDGYTDDAGHTYVGAASKDGRTYAVAFMGAKSNDWQPASKLLDWAFAHGGKARAVGSLPTPGAPVPAAAAPSAAPAAATRSEEQAAAAERQGPLGALLGAAIMLAKALAWIVVALLIAAVGLRVRKLRRDARRREARAAARVTRSAPLPETDAIGEVGSADGSGPADPRPADCGPEGEAAPYDGLRRGGPSRHRNPPRPGQPRPARVKERSGRQ